MQRVGLDRIDLAARPPAHQQPAGSARTAGRRASAPRAPATDRCALRREPLAERHAEQADVHEGDAETHHRDDQPGDRADQGSQRNESRFTRTHQGAQRLRNFDAAGEPCGASAGLAEFNMPLDFDCGSLAEGSPASLAGFRGRASVRKGSRAGSESRAVPLPIPAAALLDSRRPRGVTRASLLAASLADLSRGGAAR